MPNIFYRKAIEAAVYPDTMDWLLPLHSPAQQALLRICVPLKGHGALLALLHQLSKT